MVKTLNGETAPAGASEVRRLRVSLRGAVQGVGFRPFVFRLACELGLAGWVENNGAGVCIEVEGPSAGLTFFLVRLDREKPALAVFHGLESVWLDAAGYSDFKIRASGGGEKTAVVLPDIATCPECFREIFDPEDRRYRYPFTNCTHCGPRFSIIEGLPYDRANTSMKRFVMCEACAAEYSDPLDRRFHAQPNACPRCGPHLELWDTAGGTMASNDEALRAAAACILEGKILALKGLGGFQLMVDARVAEVVQRLRQRKHREEKPFAVMFPSMAAIKQCCDVAELEERLLGSPESPIVLLKRRGLGEGTGGIQGTHRTDRTDRPDSTNAEIAPTVAPGNPYVGAMLPYTPLHHLLMAELGFPVVATSGNLSDEPICLDEQEALQRLHGIADVWLVHDRPIVRQVDDSLTRVMLGREMVLRRARGYAPLPVHLRGPVPPLLAVGAHLKNSVAISVGSDVVVSQHVGDLETPEAFRAFRRVIESFERLYDLRPTAVACDAHPDYRSTKFARECHLPIIPVQHHQAHVWSCLTENELEPPVLGVAWDGTGYGLDGSVWGGEFLHVEADAFQRLATLRPFRLPGGDVAVQEPRRVVLGLLYEMFGPAALSMKELAPIRAFKAHELDLIGTMLRQRLNTPWTTSAGRLFDAVASLIGLRQTTRFEGQAAMELEFALAGYSTEAAYALRILPGGAANAATDRAGLGVPASAGETFALSRAAELSGVPPAQAGSPKLAAAKAGSSHSRPALQSVMIIIDWEPMIWGLLEDVRCRVPVGLMAAKFHNTLVEAMVAVARLIGVEPVVLTGGCFQNRYLTERAVQRLVAEGFRPYWHQRIPPNDGGIALGQIMAAAHRPLSRR